MKKLTRKVLYVHKFKREPEESSFLAIDWYEPAQDKIFGVLLNTPHRDGLRLFYWDNPPKQYSIRKCLGRLWKEIRSSIECEKIWSPEYHWEAKEKHKQLLCRAALNGFSLAREFLLMIEKS